MRPFILILLLLITSVVPVFAGGADPDLGEDPIEWILTVQDAAIGTTLEIVDADTGFTQQTSDTTISAAWAAQSKLDSLRAGNDGVGDVTAVFTMASSADQSINNNFFQDKGTGTVAYVTAVFGDGASPQDGAYLTREEDADFNLGATWSIATFAAGYSPGNPAVSTVQTVFSAFGSAGAKQEIRIDFLPGGFVTGYVTDDGGSTADSLIYSADVYDSTYHFVSFSCASSTLRLRVDNATAQTKSLTNALDLLAEIDTITVMAASAGANDFRGRVDELYLLEDSGAVNAEMEDYLWLRFLETSGAATDTAWVKMNGILDTGRRASSSMRPSMTAAAVSSRDYSYFENAWLDSAASLPILVFTTGASPRATKLDSIPAGAIHNPIAHRLWGSRDEPYVEWVQFTHLAGRDTTLWELRVYPNVADARDLADDYYILANARLNKSETTAFRPLGTRLPQSSMIAVFSKAASGSVEDIKGEVTIYGRDEK